MRTFAITLRLALGVGVVAIALSLSVPASSQAVDPSPPAHDVNVVNTPSVSITGTPNVNVANTSSNPVPTAEVFRPSKASQLVTVMASHTFCTFGGIARNRTFITTQNPDGTTSPFTV